MSFLKNLIGEKLYEKQKEVLRDLQDSVTAKGKHVINQIKEDSYIVQKEVIREAQEELEEKAREAYSAKASDLFDKIVSFFEKQGVVGRILAKVLKSKKKEILEALKAS